MEHAKRIAEPFLTWLVLWLALHGIHWLMVRYFGSLLPPAFSPATWTGDGIDAFVVTGTMAAHNYIHKATEKRQKPTPSRSSPTLPKREGEE